jgi:hypothetical protein
MIAWLQHGFHVTIMYVVLWQISASKKKTKKGKK